MREDASGEVGEEGVDEVKTLDRGHGENSRSLRQPGGRRVFGLVGVADSRGRVLSVSGAVTHEPHCCSAIAAEGRVLLVDTVIPWGNAPHGGKVLDVMMMASLPGRERTEKEFGSLFAQAGLRFTCVIPTTTALSITEALVA
jgi:hypothetical protein